MNLSLEDPAENLAVDEALLALIDNDSSESSEMLRLWDFKMPAVVIGRASKIHDEANVSFCESKDIPILRRCSGGTAVTAGPGCLMYSLVLDLRKRPSLRNVDLAHEYVMQGITTALSSQLEDIRFQGTCDLTWQNRKFSGNALRVGRNGLLYHGTLLHSFPLDLLHQSLGHPPRQPDYRGERNHKQFVTNLPIEESILRELLIDAFSADQVTELFPKEHVAELAATKYSLKSWNYRR